ncbi:hypothetical protein [Ancylobacter lacus]|uniref:hypothetical protein n=1 Tax=Ancylobacter lacus TaxID=2579970 RepID=UPI001BCB26FC|nr:hypothetical protein [Ancylobacter lacus]MBS7539496.1 hypothetical protein [Ancylobacter lacus]
MPTVDRLRHDIDRGLTGDKVPFPDPAAAPLGTDDEAAGTPASPEAIAHARRVEAGGDARRGPAVTDESTRGYSGEAHPPGAVAPGGGASGVLAGDGIRSSAKSAAKRWRAIWMLAGAVLIVAVAMWSMAPA